MGFAWFLHKSEASMVEVCLIWDQTSNGPFLTLNHFLGIFAGWDFGQALIFNVFLHIFKIRDKKNWNSEHFTKPVDIFGINLSKCYSSGESMAYFLVSIVNSRTKNLAKNLNTVVNDHTVKMRMFAKIRALFVNWPRYVGS